MKYFPTRTVKKTKQQWCIFTLLCRSLYFIYTCICVYIYMYIFTGRLKNNPNLTYASYLTIDCNSLSVLFLMKWGTTWLKFQKHFEWISLSGTSNRSLPEKPSKLWIFIFLHIFLVFFKSFLTFWWILVEDTILFWGIYKINNLFFFFSFIASLPFQISRDLSVTNQTIYKSSHSRKQSSQMMTTLASSFSFL